MRLTTDEEYPHGAEGKSVDKLTGHWCRGVFEATACIEKLARYENTGLEPEELRELDRLYLEKCREVTALKRQNRWIPVEEQLPEIGEPVLVTLWDRDVTIGIWYGHRWGTALYYSEDVLAWMPKPENYRPAD